MSDEQLKTASDALVNKLYAESRHRQEKAKAYRSELTTVKAENEKLKAEHDKVKADHDKLSKELETYKTEPNALKEELDRLKGEVRTGKHKEAFKKLAADHKVKGEAVDDLYRLLDIKAESDEVDEAHLTSLVEEAVKARPYFLAADEAPAPKEAPRAFPAPGYSRGGSETTPSGFTVKRSELSKINKGPDSKRYLEAFKNNTLRILED